MFAELSRFSGRLFLTPISVAALLLGGGASCARAKETAGNDPAVATPNTPLGDPLVLQEVETAGMSMFRPQWDTPILLEENGFTELSFPSAKDKTRGAAAWWGEDKLKGRKGALAFDALNRSLLVRFPGAAAQIAAALGQGKTIAKLELELPFKDEELFPPGGSDFRGSTGYNYRANWGVSELYEANRPQWHAVAWALRRPWRADGELGPTFNAAINGKQFWTKYGAADEKTDRFPQTFGPAEVSYQKTEPLDITSLVQDASFGATLGHRLRALEENGFLVRKEETYDHRFFRGVYEWATATGGRGIIIGKPRLIVTLAPANGRGTATPLPPAAGWEALSRTVSGKPTATIPDDATIEAMAKKMEEKPAWMADWQWERVQELFQVSQVKKDPREPLWVMFVPSFILDANYRQGYWAGPGDYRYKSYASAPQVYSTWVDNLIMRQPRGWSGFETATEYQEWQAGKDVLPGPAKDAIKRYWTAWLMPDRETAPEGRLLDFKQLDGRLVHPMVDQLTKGSNTNAKIEGDSYWLKTGDWRGNKSFFRSGFCYTMSTQNFNTTSSTGAFLFGNLIEAPLAIKDGRHGVDKWLLNGWTLSDGIGQEFIDHYYYTVSLKGLKALQNGASTPGDQLLADSLVNKGVQEAMAAWHPNLKRCIAPSGRTSLNYLLGSQDGLNYLMNVFSRRGVLTDKGEKRLPGNFATFGEETPAPLVAGLSMQKPWVWNDLAIQADEKPLPYEMTAWGRDTWNRTYLGKHYGMASAFQFGGRIQAMAQWRRQDKEVTSARDLTTLDVRMGPNDTRWANDAGGWIAQHYRQTVAQQGNRWLIAASPSNWDGGVSDGKVPVKSFQASLGIFDIRNMEPEGKTTLEIFLDGKPAPALPVTAKAGQSIVIKDGVTFVAVKAMPSPDLGRDAEIVLREGPPQNYDYNGKHTYKPALEINSYIVKKDEPLSKEFDWYALAQSYAGFAVTIGDASEGTFESFLKKAAASQVRASFDAQTRKLSAHATWDGQPIRLDMVTAAAKGADGKWQADFKGPAQAFDANGADLYSKPGILMETPLEFYGWNRIQKNGATLATSLAETKGCRLMLQTSRDGKRYMAWNAQGRAADLQLSLPGGLLARSDGMLGIASLEADLEKRLLRVRNAYMDGGQPGGKGQANTNASAVVLKGFGPGWTYEVNGARVTAPLTTATIGGAPCQILPLAHTPRDAAAMEEMLSKMDGAANARSAASPRPVLLHYRVAGLFPNAPGVHGPEANPGAPDFKAVYKGAGIDGADVKWRTTLDFSRECPVFGAAGGSPKQGEGITFFRIPPERPTKPGTYYLLAQARSAVAQTVSLNFNLRIERTPPEEMRAWLNGQEVTFGSVRGGRVRANLRAGDNILLFKIRQSNDAVGSEQPLLSLGEPIFGLPTLTNVEWLTLHGTTVPANPMREALIASENDGEKKGTL